MTFVAKLFSLHLDLQNFDGLFEILANHTVNMEKRAYQCIKFLVLLFSNCETALNILKRNRDVKQKWRHAVAWLNDCLHFSTISYQQYNNINWTSANQGDSGSYALERSNSATFVLAKAEAMLADEDLANDSESVDMGIDGEECDEQSPPNETEMEGPLSNNLSQLAIEHDDGAMISDNSCQPNVSSNDTTNANDSSN